jgi:hypothetical protein
MNSMLLRIHSRLGIPAILFFGLINITTVFAGGWTDKVPQFPGNFPNKIICRDVSGNQLVMVNEPGEVWVTNDGGYIWKNAAPLPGPLFAAEMYYGVDTVLIAGGQDGNIYRSTNFGQNWTTIPIGASDITSIAGAGGRIWAGSSTGALFYSTDRGLTWFPATINRGPMSIIEIVPTRYGAVIAAIRDTTAFILADVNTDDIFEPVDSIANVTLTSGMERFDKLYFAGSDNISGGPMILIKEDFGGLWGPANPYTPSLAQSGIADIEGLTDSGDRLWISTFDGHIYEGDIYALSFLPVYENFSGNFIRSIASTPEISPVTSAWAAGSNGLMLVYDFIVVDLAPHPNEVLDPALNRFEIKFSDIPDLISVERGIFIHSTIKGLITFTAAYASGDSTMIDLTMTNGGAVPGESFTIILTNIIKELKSSNRFKRIFSYRVNVSSMNGSDLTFTAPTALLGAGTASSNYVTGFFNSDEYFDLVTFTDTDLIFFEGRPGGGFAAPVTQPITGPVKIDGNLPQQLKKADIDLDGKPDLILYDRSNYQVYTNTSNAGFSFIAGPNKMTNNLTDIEFTSIDNDSTMDMILLSDSLQLRTNVDVATAGVSDYAELNSGWDQVETGDVDDDGITDLMILTTSGEILMRHGTHDGGFDMSYTIPGRYDLIKFGEIDNDGTLEVMATEDSIIHIYKFSQPWTFDQLSIIFQNSQKSIESFNTGDFNSDHMQDVMVSTAAREFKVFLNTGDGIFKERPEQQKLLDIVPTGITTGDFNQDGALDYVFYNTGSGDFQIINSVPGVNNLYNFDSVKVESDAVFLQWKAYEPQGDLEFYNVYRTQDTTAKPYPLLGTPTTNSFTDSIVISGETYWYIIEAMDIFGSPHFIGQIQIKVPKALVGEISGVLSDTLTPYIVKNPISIPPDSSLMIMPGVKILFDINASLTVYGKLQVQGNPEHLVYLQSATNDTSRRWEGITISSLLNTDTVYMSWFNVQGAKTAFNVQNRPLDVRYATISNNRTGFEVQFIEGSVKAEHIIVKKNTAGLRIMSNSEANLKNVTIADNVSEGVLGAAGTTVKIKNAIIWNNNFDRFRIKTGPDIQNNSANAMTIAYSTVDSISGNTTGKYNSRIPPIFQVQTSDSMDYRPDPLSATIDAGDPADDFTQEPQPNGGRINQGIYGGTAYATPSLQPQIGVMSDTLRLAIQPGFSTTKNLVIRNKGFQELEINNIELHRAEFNYAASFPVKLLPGDSAAFTISFKPPARGSFNDVIFIQSNDPHYPPPGKPLVLAGTGLNRPPKITTAGLINGVQDFAYHDNVTAVDEDGDALAYQALNVPLWMAVSPSGQLDGTPPSTSVGTNIPVVIRVSDGFGGSDTLQTTISVLNINDRPRIITTVLKQAIQDQAYSDTVFAVDIDKDTLIFNGLEFPGWLKIASDGVLSGTPGNDDVFGDNRVVITVTDNNGTFDTLFTAITVVNINDPPEFKSIPDTVAYTFIPFQYDMDAIDIDGDKIRYEDDSPLFIIQPDSGIIRFTPVVADTGVHKITVTVSDQDTSIINTFQLRVNLTPLTAIPAPAVTAMDQEINLDWKQPDNLFYSGTIIAWSDLAAVTNPGSAKGIIDTSFSAGESVMAKIRNLEIAKTYFLSVFNYYDADARIYSDPVQVTVTTLAPKVQFDNSERVVHVPPGETTDTLITVRNTGGGTMVIRFAYTPDVLTGRWFTMDTLTHIVAPFDSVRIPVSISPVESMTDIDHKVSASLLTNEPGWIPQQKTIILRILFDKYAPKLFMLSQPDTIHSFSALRFEFTANDTVNLYNWKFGAATDSLRARYKFVHESLDGEQILKQESGIKLGAVDFFPLPDGLYRFELWVYDPDGNGLVQTAYKRRVLVSTSTIPVAANRWYLTSFPRKTNLNLYEFFTDSSALIYRWNNDQNKYISYVDSTLEAGEAIWLLSYKPRKFNLEKIPVSTDSDSVVVRLVKGWNQIGIPRGYHLNLGESKFIQHGGQVLDMREAVSQKLIAPAVYWYRASVLLPGYEWGDIDTTIASPWRGYWVLAAEPGQFVLPYMPAYPKTVNINSARTDTNSTRLAKSSTADEWQVAFALISDKYADNGNIIGLTAVRTGLPVYEPPHLDKFCSAYFNSPDGKITRDLRTPFDDYREVKTWDLVIESSSIGAEHALSWSSKTGSAGVYLYLADPAAEKIIDMQEVSAYSFEMQAFTRIMKVYATQDAEFEPKIIPLSFRLDQNYPNPFNPVTTIRFGVPGSSAGQKIRLTVFNILGQEIRILVDGELEAGYHEIQWDGTNAAGIKVSSGVYFYRLNGPGQALVKKMVLIK